MESSVAASAPEQMRAALADQLSARKWIKTSVVDAAFRAVPRHLFAPAGTTMQAAYADDVVITKKTAEGRTCSSISAPWLSLSTPVVLRGGRHRLDTSLTCSL